jgi:predicted GIY-YIG superfamily endonuclease
MIERHPSVYILAGGRHGTLYIGVPRNSIDRLLPHGAGRPLASRRDPARIDFLVRDRRHDGARHRTREATQAPTPQLE